MFPISHSLCVNYPALCILRLQLESPALNQAHPVSLCIKSQCAQSCLLDCTVLVSSVFTIVIPQSLNPSVLSQSFCLLVYLFLVSPSTLPFSVLFLLGNGIVPCLELDYVSSLSTWYFSPVTPGINPRLSHGPVSGFPLISLFAGSRPLDCSTTLWVFLLNHCIPPELCLSIGSSTHIPDRITY